jgi:hypothetical protein
MFFNALGAIFLAAASALLLPSQTVPQPLASAGNPNLSPVRPTTSVIARVENPRDPTTKRLWIASMIAAAAASGFDAGSSWGKQEGNGLLASSNGTFGARGLCIKAGILSGVIVPQVVFRKHRELRTRFLIGNFAEAGIFTGIAVHNLGVTSPR